MNQLVLVVAERPEEPPVLIDSFSDEAEIQLLESSIAENAENPIGRVYEYRNRKASEEEEFGDSVESLLSNPFLSPEIQHHAVQWFRSKHKIEEFQRSETEARQVIASYAYLIYCKHPELNDFLIEGRTATVRVRVFRLPNSSAIRCAS